MTIIGDTCAILMLLRIAPDMFKDARYACATLPSVLIEIKRNQKFKSKYSWRNDYLHHIQTHPLTDLNARGFEANKKDVNAVCRQKRSSQGKYYIDVLSMVDRELAAALLCLDATLCSGDGNLASFVEEELETTNKSALELVNDWLEQRLFQWDDARQAVIAEWIAQERPQPTNQAKRFERLTGRRYCDR